MNCDFEFVWRGRNAGDVSLVQFGNYQTEFRTLKRLDATLQPQ
jgi:hypothetical protein